MKNLLLISFLLFGFGTYGQQNDSEVYSDLNRIDKKPEYVGGFEALNEFIGSELKYPEQAKKNKTEGTVIVWFIVEKDGTTSSASADNRIGNGCEEEAVRVVSLLGPWTPGMKDGQAVRVSYKIPIKFAL